MLMSIIDSASSGGDRTTNDSRNADDTGTNAAERELFPSSEQEEPETELSRDMVFDVLKNRRRRYALHYLKQQEGSVKLSDLAEQVAAWENDTTINNISAAERKRVYTALYQSHLPKLDDAGIVDYNQNRGIVELTEKAAELDVYLELVTKDDISWSKYYLGLAMVGMSVVTAAWLQLPVFSSMPDIVWAVLIVAAFTASAAAHTYHTRRQEMGSSETPPEVDPR